MIILDTNVISALMRPENNTIAVDWMDRQSRDDLWISAISIMEIRTGLLQMPAGRRQQNLIAGFDELLEAFFARRSLPFDATAAHHAAFVSARQKSRGRNPEIGDHQIAGICIAHRASLATRNIKDFAGLDITLLNPWA